MKGYKVIGMKRVAFSLAVVLVVVLVGCGEENPATDTKETEGKYNLIIEGIGGWQINKMDNRVIFSVSIENRSQTPLPLNEEMIWLEDSDNQVVYCRLFARTFGAPAEILAGGKATFPISYIMGEDGTFGEFVCGKDIYGDRTAYKKSKDPYKLVGLFNETRVVVELPTLEEIKSRLTSNPFNSGVIISNPIQEPEPGFTEPEPVPFADVNLKEYFPLAIGNSWTYNRSGNIYKLFIDQTVEIKGEKYFQMKYESDGKVEDMKQCLAISPDGKELWQNGPYAYIDQTMIVGEERVTVPAGTFDCIKVKRKVDVTGGTRSMYEWYGKGVGLVKIDHNLTIDNPATLKDYLIDYRIN